MKIVPLSKENHHNWSYTGLPHYLHTVKDSIVPILIAEIGRLVSTNPIVFIEEEEKIGLFSLQSLLPEMNLMINREGLWVNDYIPARYRSLPFVLASDQKDKTGKEKILCYIEDLNCVAQTFDKALKYLMKTVNYQKICKGSLNSCKVLNKTSSQRKQP